MLNWFTSVRMALRFRNVHRFSAHSPEHIRVFALLEHMERQRLPVCVHTLCTKVIWTVTPSLVVFPRNYGTNYILSDHSDFVVIEADEFDRSFHWLRPWMSVITSTDPDHLDIYGTKEAYLESFRHYTELIQKGGALIIRKGLEMKPNVQEGVRIYEYSRDEGDFHAENIRIANGTITFDFVSPIENIKDIELGQPIPINIETVSLQWLWLNSRLYGRRIAQWNEDIWWC